MRDIKKMGIILGSFYILLSLATIYPNDVIGHHAFFATDFLHNLTHLLIGSVLLGVTLWDDILLPKVLRIVGFILIGLAVLGSWFTGSDIGAIFGLIAANGIGHVVHLLTGIFSVVASTHDKRVMHAVQTMHS